MNTLLLLVLCVISISICNAFSPIVLQRKGISNTITSTTNLLASSKRSNPNGYWEGEWVCADCGYVYDIDFDGGGLYFEEQKKGFICPQCSAPRKRYAKKVGDQWGITRDGGDFPIYFLTFAGLAATAYFSLVVVPTL